MKFLFTLLVILTSSLAIAHSAPLCSALFTPATTVHPIDGQKAWGPQLFQRDLNIVKDAFTASQGLPPESRVEFLLQNDTRRVFFRLQSLSRLYQELDNKRFASLRTTFKTIEDGIGALDLARGLRVASEKVSEPDLVQYFAKKEKAALQALIQILNKEDLLEAPERFITRMEKQVKNSEEWGSGKDDRKYLFKILAFEMKRLQKDVKDEAFDSKDIEKGLHELRRRLRWLVIGATSLNGAVRLEPIQSLSPEVRRWFGEMRSVNPRILENKYLTLQPADIRKPLLIPQQSFAMVAELVQTIGNIKDHAEIQIYLHEALDHLHAGARRHAELEAKLEKTYNVKTVDHRALANDVQKRLKESQLLKELRHAMENLAEAQ